MDKIFNPTRFYKYLNRYVILNSNLFIIFTVSVSLYPLFLLLYRTFFRGNGVLPTETLYIFLVMLAIAPCLFASNMNKNNKVFEFTLPVTAFEKFLTNFLNYVIILPVSCLLINAIIFQLYFLIPHENIISMKESFDYTPLVNWTNYYIILAVQSIYWVGTYYFQRLSLIRTSLFLLFLTMTFCIILIIFSFFFLIDTFGINPFLITENFSITEENMPKLANPEDFYLKSRVYHQIDNILRYTFIALIPAGMWITSFFKIRETEI